MTQLRHGRPNFAVTHDTRRLVLLLQLIHHRPRQDDDIRRLALENALFQFGG